MKRILFIPAILLLMMAGSSYSCGEKQESNSENAILGIWKLIEQGADENSIKPVKHGDLFIPDGEVYIEYRSDGTVRYYDNEKKEFFDRGNYKIHSDSLIYHFKDTDRDYDIYYKYNLVDKDKLKLVIIGSRNLMFEDIYGYPFAFIYLKQ